MHCDLALTAVIRYQPEHIFLSGTSAAHIPFDILLGPRGSWKRQKGLCVRVRTILIPHQGMHSLAVLVCLGQLVVFFFLSWTEMTLCLLAAVRRALRLWENLGLPQTQKFTKCSRRTRSPTSRLDSPHLSRCCRKFLKQVCSLDLFSSSLIVP